MLTCSVTVVDWNLPNVGTPSLPHPILRKSYRPPNRVPSPPSPVTTATTLTPFLSLPVHSPLPTRQNSPSVQNVVRVERDRRQCKRIVEDRGWVFPGNLNLCSFVLVPFRIQGPNFMILFSRRVEEFYDKTGLTVVERLSWTSSES